MRSGTGRICRAKDHPEIPGSEFRTDLVINKAELENKLTVRTDFTNIFIVAVFWACNRTEKV